MQDFAEIHRFDGRIDFKENFEIWSENKKDLIDNEKRRFELMGYKKDDLLDKIYKSIRYYYCKKIYKSEKIVNDKDKDKDKDKRNYLKLDNSILYTINQFMINLDNFDQKSEDVYNIFLSKNPKYKNKSNINKIKKSFKNKYSRLKSN